MTDWLNRTTADLGGWANAAVVAVLIPAVATVLVALIRRWKPSSEVEASVSTQATAFAHVLIEEMRDLRARLTASEAEHRGCEEALAELSRRVRVLESERPPGCSRRGQR